MLLRVHATDCIVSRPGLFSSSGPKQHNTANDDNYSHQPKQQLYTMMTTSHTANHPNSL